MVDLLTPTEGSWNKKYPGYKFAVHGFSHELLRDTPEFTNCTKTLVGAETVQDRFKAQGLLAEIVPIGEMKGANPRFEKEL
jgi:hypothetical protein